MDQCYLLYDHFVSGNSDLSDQNGRYSLGFGAPRTAFDQLVSNGHRSMTNSFRVTNRRSLVDIFDEDMIQTIYENFLGIFGITEI